MSNYWGQCRGKYRQDKADEMKTTFISTDVLYCIQDISQLTKKNPFLKNWETSRYSMLLEFSHCAYFLTTWSGVCLEKKDKLCTTTVPAFNLGWKGICYFICGRWLNLRSRSCCKGLPVSIRLLSSHHTLNAFFTSIQTYRDWAVNTSALINLASYPKQSYRNTSLWDTRKNNN